MAEHCRRSSSEIPAGFGSAPRASNEGELLLAVIHGYGANDWRDPETRQTFLLKNVAGSDLKVESGKEFVKAHSGKRLPRPQGDLIGEKLLARTINRANRPRRCYRQAGSRA